MKSPYPGAAAQRLQQLIRQRGQYGHVEVRSRTQHLIVEVVEEAGREPVARATAINAQEYGLSFRSHTGRWEPLPIVGKLEDIARAITEELGAYIDPANL